MTDYPENVWSWRHAILQSDLPATTSHVLLTIACYINDVGVGCYPTTKQLAAATRLSERAICTHIAIAREAGWLEVSKHGFAGQKWQNNEYRPLWPSRKISVQETEKALNEVQHQGTERGSVASSKALNVLPKGTEPNDKKALNEVQSNSPINNPINNTLSETSSDETRKEKKGIKYPEAFEALWKAYPIHQNMSKKEAFDAWKKLDDEDRAAVFNAVPGYKAFLSTKPDLETVHLCRFISKRRFDGYVAAPKQEAAPTNVTNEDWQKRLGFARQQRRWSVQAWGPMPHTDESQVPADLLQPEDGCGWATI